ncbi:MAG: spore coat protein CotJB [Christensenellaceae bacterium]|nr:spore coat protein CotJB [Christensenellaceae bacterium]
MKTCRTDQKSLMLQIMQCEFVLIDINLFLDTHPSDERALADYNCYAEQLAALKKMYTESYGPIHNFGNSLNYSETEWLWSARPFPWQSCCTEV